MHGPSPACREDCSCYLPRDTSLRKKPTCASLFCQQTSVLNLDTDDGARPRVATSCLRHT